MLLQFICILVENDTDFDLARNKVARGEIYWRLVRCIYRKYCEGRNVRFDEDELTQILNRIGKFALKTLKDKQSCFQREEIIRELGENVFELGFLVGYEDFRLVANETADISVTFLHETLRTFFAYFHLHRKDCSGEMEHVWNTVCSKDLTQMFDNTDEGFLLTKCIKDIDCLHFYLSLSKLNVSAAFGLELLAMFIKRLFHCKTLHFINTHEINIFQTVNQKDYLNLTFLRKVLGQCNVPEYLSFCSGQSVEWILESLHHLREQIKLITILPIARHDTNKLRSLGKRKAVIDELACSEVSSIVKFFPEPFDLLVHTNFGYTFFKGQKMGIDLSELMGPGMRQVHISCFQLRGDPRNALGHCKASGDLQRCFNMTHLVFNYLWIKPCFVRALTKALRNGYLPLLEHLSFEGCIFGGELDPTHLNVKHREPCKNELELLFLSLTNVRIFTSLVLSVNSINLLPQCTWVNLSSLWLHELDTLYYKLVITNLNEGYAPRLNELGLSLAENLSSENMEDAMTIQIRSLTHLSLHKVIHSMRHLYEITKSKCLTNLQKLDISHSSGIRGGLSILLCHSFPPLNTLILNNCELNSQDLRSLAKANMKGRIPELKHLDISQNILFQNDLDRLFELNCKWEQLLSLNVEDTLVCFSDLNAEVKSGGLSALRDLRVCVDVGVKDPTTAEWPSLTDLQVHLNQNPSQTKVFASVSELIHRNGFPSLKNVYLTRNYSSHGTELMHPMALWISTVKFESLYKAFEGIQSLEMTVMDIIRNQGRISPFKQEFTRNVSSLADSLKDGIDPSKREDFMKGVCKYIIFSLGVTFSKSLDDPTILPLLQYNFYESYRTSGLSGFAITDRHQGRAIRTGQL